MLAWNLRMSFASSHAPTLVNPRIAGQESQVGQSGLWFHVSGAFALRLNTAPVSSSSENRRHGLSSKRITASKKKNSRILSREICCDDVPLRTKNLSLNE